MVAIMMATMAPDPMPPISILDLGQALRAVLLAVLLGVVPGAARVGHHDGHHRATSNPAREHADEAARADEEAHEERREDGVGAGRDHLPHTGLRGDGDALVAVGND